MEALKVLADDGGLDACGPSVRFLRKRTIETLRSVAASKAQNRNAEAAAETADDLLQLAKEKINAYHYKDVPSCWRQLYTDATILYVLATVFSLKDVAVNEDVVFEGIRRLDMAIIVAGAPGPGRTDVIFGLIRQCQTKLHPIDAKSSEEESRRKRRKVNDGSPAPVPASDSLDAPPIINPIPVLASPPTLASFLSTHSHRPFILRSFCRDWPACDSNAGWSSPQRLREIAGKGRVVPVEVGGDYTEEGWGQRLVRWEDFLSSVFPSSDEDDRKRKQPVFYLAQHDLFSQLPSLRNDIVLPDYLYSSPSPPSSAPEYRPPPNEEGYTLNAWLGPKGTVSQAHTDPYFNCYAQVVGRKYVWVAPPDSSEHMYAFAKAADEDDEAAEPPNGTYSSLMTNTTRIDVIAAMGSLSDNQPDYFTEEAMDRRDHFPAFFEKVAPKSWQAVLEEGDLLIMPPKWWHSMKSLTTSFSVSMWF